MLIPDSYMRQFGIIAALMVAVFALYGQVATHDFLNFDDPDYVYENVHVLQGLTYTNVVWAFTTTHAANWHPLTWLSHMLDVQLFGLNPAGHHLVNVVLHALNSALLFLLLARITGTVWRAAVVAALFALHPLHVESTAWVAERKDLLCACFGLVCLHFYASYVMTRSLSRYLAVTAALVLSLLAKPMLVTLPFLMLLLDYWPLQCVAKTEVSSIPPLQRLLLEKMPFLLIITTISVVTVFAQKSGQALATIQESPFSFRLANALVAYVTYLAKALWPGSLAILYPLPEQIPLWKPVVAGALLLVCTILTMLERRRRPYLVVGWLWYLGTLIPVIGLVQVGSQAMADRYTYVPLIGIFLMVVWGAAEITRQSPAVGVTVVAVVLIGYSVVSWRQLSLWTNDVNIYRHTLAVTRNNWMIQNNLGYARLSAGDNEEANRHFRNALEINPQFAKAYFNLAQSLHQQGRIAESIATLRQAHERLPEDNTILNDLASYLLLSKEPTEAIKLLDTVVRTGGGKSPETYFNLGYAYGAQGDKEKAIDAYQQGIMADPKSVACRYNLAVELYNTGRYGEAASHFNQLLRLHPNQEIVTMSRKFLQRISEQP
jgi:Tfp pilus assembly protein PilF